jgi:hypothetical protein
VTHVGVDHGGGSEDLATLEAPAGVGGAIAINRFPLARSDGPMAIVAQLTPHAHAIEGCYRLMAEKGSLVNVLPQLGILLGMAVLLGVVAARRFRYE